uniref:RNA-directed RNA polymerase C-terminal domain-containing protein n=1 Tax=Riboviria sp. TaxID=2585031 RepID=A0A8K1U424_9VIRU|nr:MAG: hypothetical protein 1 [Riboviria sp.]
MDNENWFDEEFDRAVLDLDPKATTGLGPMSYYGCDVGTALGYDPFVGFDSERVQILRSLVRHRWMTGVRTPDPILVFIKPEPCKDSKVRSGLVRIISAVGLVDTMVDRIQFGWLARISLEQLGRTPSLVGWSPYQGGYRYLSSLFAGEQVMCADRSNWDWTVRGWLLVAVKEVIRGLALDAPKHWHEWLDARWEALFRDAVFGFRSGERIAQPGWGVMKSGCYLTILINSISQVLLHSLVSMRLRQSPDFDYYKVVGDDTVQRVPPNVGRYLDELKSLGVKIKEHTISKTIEFCGHVIRGTYCAPAYRGKHAFKICTASPDTLPALLRAYIHAYAMDDEMWEWLIRLVVEEAPAEHRTRGRCLDFILSRGEY